MHAADTRWGILGPGFIADRFAADAAGARGSTVVAVGARDGERAQRFADRHGIARAYAGYDALLADPDVEIVYIATPHSHHYEHALAALRAGKSVLVEKPFTMDAAEAESLVREASARGLLAMEGMWTLCNPLVLELLTRVRRGDIGEPLAVTANVGPLGVPVVRGSGLRMEDPALGASYLLECLVYPLALTVALVPALADPQLVHAAATFSSGHIDEAATIILGQPDGPIASMGGGFAFGSTGRAPSRLQITGTQGWAEIADDLFNPALIRVESPAGLEELASDDASRGFAWEIEEAARAHAEGLGESRLVPIAHTLTVMRLLDRARAAAGITVGSRAR